MGFALRVGHLHLTDGPGEIHVDAGQSPAGRIFDGDVDPAGEHLGRRRRRETDRERERKAPRGETTELTVHVGGLLLPQRGHRIHMVDEQTLEIHRRK